MEAKELRIGNLVNANGVYEGEIKTFKRFNEDLSVVFFSDGSKHGIGEYLEDIKPIPLTEEWLLKFGFEKAENDFRIQIQKDNRGGSTDYWIYVDTGFDNETNQFTIQLVSQGGDWFCSEQKYVHQLQNLYFALTGKELTIK